MSDDQLPDRAEQASAYLDGELEADERAIVEDDADAMAMVDSFARIRGELRNVDPVDDAVRSAAMAAALAEFDARHEEVAVPAVAAAVVTPLPSRRDRGYRVLMGVAAAVVVAVVGIAALNTSKGNDANSTALVASDQTAEPPQLKIAADTAAADANSAAGAAPTGTAAPGAQSIESAVSSLPEIDSKEELEAFARSFRIEAAAPAPAATTAGTTAGAATATPALGDSSFESPCVTPEQTALAQVLYRGAPAVVVRVNASGTIVAIAIADCAVLDTVP
jgi:negative regulator of sigma E activity